MHNSSDQLAPLAPLRPLTRETRVSPGRASPRWASPAWASRGWASPGSWCNWSSQDFRAAERGASPGSWCNWSWQELRPDWSCHELRTLSMGMCASPGSSWKWSSHELMALEVERWPTPPWLFKQVETSPCWR